MYTSASSMMDACKEQNKKIYELQLQEEMEAEEPVSYTHLTLPTKA